MAGTTPKISVVERRLAGASVFRTASAPVPMKDARWTVRWENSTISPDHMWNILHNLGWVYVAPSDLDCPVEEIGAYERDGRVVRGERGSEVLVKMLAKDYRSVQKKKAQEVRTQTFGSKAVKAAVVEGVGAAHGEDAAAFVADRVQTMTVTDSRGPEDA